MALTIVAAYDVSNDDRRARLAALLQVWGDRIQRSVFLLAVPDGELPDLIDQARRKIDTNRDSLYFFRLCQNCWNSHETIGQAHEPTDELAWIVM